VSGFVLVTGYSYYGKYWFNPSGEVARLLDGARFGDYVVKSVVMPVSLKAVKSTLPRLLRELEPSLAIGLGLSPGYREVVVELAAANYAYFDTDVDGYKAELEPVDPEGPPIVYTTLPLKEIIRKCRGERLLPIRPGLGTGLYMCNVAAYMLMRYGLERGVPAGFVHVPPSTENYLRGEAPSGLPLSEILESIKCIIEEALRAALLGQDKPSAR